MLSYFNPLPSLPEYSGPYKVGSVEYEVPLTSLYQRSLPKGVSLSSIKFRLFYPTTPDASGHHVVPWLQEPQTEYLDGYLKLARINPWLSSILRSVPFYLRSTTIPARAHAPLAYDGSSLPVLIFSHGLVGNMNTHSAILGETASYGIFCVAIEHRDGSGPLSMVRNGNGRSDAGAPTEMTSIYFKSISLKIKPEAYEERDKQLQIRILELMATYQALEMLNSGLALDNFARGPEETFQIPKHALNLEPSSVIWAGHSFGGTTLIQFIKSVYYSNSVEKARNPLLLQEPSATLIAQISPSSPVVLLDPWFLPLKSPQMQWLLHKPLPCRDVETEKGSRTTVIMCSEFAHHWPECHSHMPVIIAKDPAGVKVQTHEEYLEEFAKYKGPRDYMNKSKQRKAFAESAAIQKVPSPQLETIAEKDEEPLQNSSPVAVSMYVLHDTTHITHSDFGVMFPWLSWWYTGQKNPVLAKRNIVRGILGAAGLAAEADAARVVVGTAGQAQMEQLQ